MSARRLSLSALAAAVTLSPTINANPVDIDVITDWQWHACNSCTFAQSSNAAAGLGHGKHYIYNLPGNQLYEFDVECEPVGGGEQCYASSITPAADAQGYFNDYHAAYLQFHSEAFLVGVNYNVPSGGPTHNGLPIDDGYVNAFDTVYGGAFDNGLRSYLMNPVTYSGALATFISVLSNGLGYDIPNLSIVVTVYFHDGSKRVYTFVQNVNAFQPVPDTAQDSQHNVLPDPDKRPGPRIFTFNGPIARIYNPNNVATLLSVSPPALPQEPLQCTWDGIQTLTCQDSP